MGLRDFHFSSLAFSIGREIYWIRVDVNLGCGQTQTLVIVVKQGSQFCLGGVGGLGWGDGRAWEGGYRTEGTEVPPASNHLSGETKDTGLPFKRCPGEGLLPPNHSQQAGTLWTVWSSGPKVRNFQLEIVIFFLLTNLWVIFKTDSSSRSWSIVTDRKCW